MTKSEIYKAFGITPKALRGYAEMGLVVPSRTDPVWEYDTEEIEKLLKIQKLMAFGMTRKETKALIDKNDPILLDSALQDSVARLEQKIRESELMIDYIHQINETRRLLSELSTDSSEAIGTQITEVIGSFSDPAEQIGPQSLSESVKGQMTFNSILKIALLRGLPPEDPSVEDSVKAAIRFICSLFEDHLHIDASGMDDNAIREFCSFLYEDMEICHELHDLAGGFIDLLQAAMGDGGTEYVKHAFLSFISKKASEYDELSADEGKS